MYLKREELSINKCIQKRKLIVGDEDCKNLKDVIDIHINEMNYTVCSYFRIRRLFHLEYYYH